MRPYERNIANCLALLAAETNCSENASFTLLSIESSRYTRNCVTKTLHLRSVNEVLLGALWSSPLRFSAICIKIAASNVRTKNEKARWEPATFFSHTRDNLWFVRLLAASSTTTKVRGFNQSCLGLTPSYFPNHEHQMIVAKYVCAETLNRMRISDIRQSRLDALMSVVRIVVVVITTDTKREVELACFAMSFSRHLTSVRHCSRANR